MANNRTYNVPLTVRKFEGLGAVINDGDQGGFNLVVKDGDENSPPLIIEHIGYGVRLQHLCKRPVVLKRCKIRSYTSSTSAGKLYLEDVEFKELVTLYPQQRVWARQYNSEILPGQIWNKGASLWVLGIKTELKGYVINTTNCGKTELLGGLVYPVKAFTSTDPPAFTSDNSQQSLIFGASAYAANTMYPVIIRERQNGITKEVKHAGQVRYIMPLHVGNSTTCFVTAPVAAPTFTPGIYKLVARHSGKTLEIGASSTTNGALAQQWDYRVGANQQWKVELVDGTYYKLTAVHSGKALDVKGYSLSDGGTVHQYTWSNTDNQKWTIAATGGGYYKITGKQSGKALEVYQGSLTNGGKVVQWTYKGGYNQQWKLEPVTAAARLAAEGDASPAAAPDLKLSPNPANQSVDAEWAAIGTGAVTIAIRNAQGAVVHQEVVSGKTRQRLPTRQLKSGFYFVVLTSAGSTATEKLIISH
jgi:hypothetical protein